MKKREIAKNRKEQLLVIALDLATKHGYQHILRDDIAAKACVTNGLVTHYFGTMAQLKRTVLKTAIKRERLDIIAQGLTARDPVALKISAELKDRVLQHLAA